MSLDWQAIPYAFPLWAVSGICLTLGLYAWRHRRAGAALPFALQMLGLAGWTFAGAWELFAGPLPAKVLFAKLRYPATLLAITAWFAVCLHYAGLERWLTRGRLAAGLAVPLLTLLLVFTNEAHGLIWPRLVLDPEGPALIVDHGPWFWVHIAYCYGLLLAGTVMVVRVVRQPARRPEGLPLLLGVLVPWVGNALDLARLNPTEVDPTPFALAVSGFAFAWGLLRLRFLDIVPAAREAVIEEMPDGMVVLDPQDRVLDLNTAAAGLLGRSRAEVLGQPFAAAWPAWAGLAAEGGQREVQIGERHLDLRVSPLHDRRGAAAGRVLVFRDLTARKRAELEMARLRDDLTHTLVHDLRNPLTSINAALQVLEPKAAHPREREIVRLGQESTARMLGLVAAILDVSRLEHAALPLDRRALALAPLLAEVLEGARAQAARREVALLATVDGEVPPLWADAGLLQRVLQNLVDNAVKFSAPGGRVVVSATQAGGMVHVSVRDEGEGVPPALRERLFNKFAAGRQPEAGSGLGLAFCRLAVEAHGGRIWAADDGRPGAEFTFTVPVAP